jgi:hypothetical protein
MYYHLFNESHLQATLFRVAGVGALMRLLKQADTRINLGKSANNFNAPVCLTVINTDDFNIRRRFRTLRDRLTPGNENALFRYRPPIRRRKKRRRRSHY